MCRGYRDQRGFAPDRRGMSRAKAVNGVPEYGRLSAFDRQTRPSFARIGALRVLGPLWAIRPCSQNACKPAGVTAKWQDAFSPSRSQDAVEIRREQDRGRR